MKRKRKSILFILSMLFMFQQPLAEVACYASNQSYVIYEKDKAVNLTVQELLNKYEIYNIDVANVRKKYELNQTKHKIYETQKSKLAEGVDLIKQEISTLSSQKLTLEQNLELLQSEYEECQKSEPVDMEYLSQLSGTIEQTQLQISGLQNQIITYQQSLTSSASSLSNTSLEAKLQQYYVDNQSILEKVEINKLKYSFLNSILSAIIMKEQEKYYTCYATNLETKEKVEKIKTKYGLSVPVNLSSLTLEKSKNKTICNQLAYAQKQIRDYVETETYQNNINLILDYSSDIKNYSKTTLITRFIDQNETYLDLTNAIKAYQDYLNNSDLDALSEQQVNQTIQSYQLQSSILRKNIEKYVSDAFEDYINVVAQLEESKSEIEYANQQYTIVNEKYKKGRATLLEVQDKELKIKESECTYYEFLIKKVKLEFIFDNYIYGVVYT